MDEEIGYYQKAPHDVSDAIVKRKIAIEELQKERRYIIEFFSDKILHFAAQQEQELQRNAQQLLDLGLPPEEISPSQYKKTGKITSQDFIERLDLFMDNGRSYSSTELIKHLGITYPIFRKLVLANPGFIEYQGINKGRVYRKK